MSTQSTVNLFNGDFLKTLFPLDTNSFLINHFAQNISKLIIKVLHTRKKEILAS